MRGDIIDLLDGGLDSPSIYVVPNAHAGLHGFIVRFDRHVGFRCKLLRRSRITFSDEILHYDSVEITIDKTISHVCETLREVRKT